MFRFGYNYITNAPERLQYPPASVKIGVKSETGFVTRCGSAEPERNETMKRKVLALVLSCLMCLGLALPAFAAVEELVDLRVDDVTAYSQEEGV